MCGLSMSIPTPFGWDLRESEIPRMSSFQLCRRFRLTLVANRGHVLTSECNLLKSAHKNTVQIRWMKHLHKRVNFEGVMSQVFTWLLSIMNLRGDYLCLFALEKPTMVKIWFIINWWIFVTQLDCQNCRICSLGSFTTGQDSGSMNHDQNDSSNVMVEVLSPFFFVHHEVEKSRFFCVIKVLL
jgi:hypothetical protein